MSSWTSSESRIISGRVEYFCKCNRQLTVQTTKIRKNSGKRFVTCSKCNVYDFLDDDLLSEYYKEFLYGMLQKQKQLKKHVDYEQLINVLAMDTSRLEEELKATKSKLKLYDRCYGSNLQLEDAIVRCKCKLQLHVENACLQMQASIASCKLQEANASFNCKLQIVRSKCKLQLQDANASCNLQAAINIQTKHSNNITNCK
ncbi:hypothetical protein Tco_0901865 [Tanacetum coccineum]